MSLPVDLSVEGGAVTLRRARDEDVPAIVDLLAADQLGASREGGDLAPYLDAFAALDGDPAQLLVVATAQGQVVGTLQLTFIPGLARRGALRAQIEAVRVGAAHRGPEVWAPRWSGGRSGRRAAGAARWSSSRPTSAGPVPAASTSASASPPPTRA
jgi:hypothetical protein